MVVYGRRRRVLDKVQTKGVMLQINLALAIFCMSVQGSMHAVGEQVSTCWAPLFYRHARNGKGEGDVKESRFWLYMGAGAEYWTRCKIKV